MPTMIQASPGPPGGGGAAASEGEEEELLAQSATQGNGSRAYQSMQGSHTTGTETPTSEAQLSANASPSIHFDERLKDLTSSVQNPVMYFATEDFAMWNPTDHHRPESFREMEETLGEEEVVVSRWPCIACAQRASPRAVRFGILILVSLVPFGSHFVKNSLSSLQVYFMDNPKLNFTGVKYGSIMSAQSLPNIVMPFLGGVILDSKGPRVGIKTFLAIALAGHIAFTLAMGAGNFPLAMGGSVIFGLGTGTLVVAQRAVVSQYFYDKELTFALGVTVAVACVAKSSAKAAAAAIAEAFGGYMAALWCGGLLLGMSFAAGAVYAKVSERAASRAGVEEHGVGHVALTPAAVGLTLRRSTLAFLCLVILHTVFIMVYHLFANFSGHYLVQMYGMTAVQAGLASSVMPLAVVFCAPVAGFVLDKFGGQLYVLLVCNIVTLLAYVLLLKDLWSPVACIVLLALCESFVPTILLSAYPLTVDRSVYGAAFGFSEVVQAFGLLLGNVYMGWVRDTTSSYEGDIIFVICMTLACLCLTLLLIVWDCRHGNILNCPRGHYGYRSLQA